MWKVTYGPVVNALLGPSKYLLNYHLFQWPKLACTLNDIIFALFHTIKNRNKTN